MTTGVIAPSDAEATPRLRRYVPSWASSQLTKNNPLYSAATTDFGHLTGHLMSFGYVEISPFSDPSQRRVSLDDCDSLPTDLAQGDYPPSTIGFAL